MPENACILFACVLGAAELEYRRQPALALPLAESLATFEGIVISRICILLLQHPSMTLRRRRGVFELCVSFEGGCMAEYA